METPAYYGSHAYNPHAIPDQPPEPYRSWLGRLGKIRLPWGNPSQCVPSNRITFDAQEALREYNLDTKEQQKKKRKAIADKFGATFDQECYREPQLSKRLHALILLYSLGRGASIVLVSMSLFVLLFSALRLGDKFQDYSMDFYQITSWVCGLPLLLWFFSFLLVKFFTNFFFTANKGAKWEINRRTGEVIIYKYTRGACYSVASPFYQFDAFLNGVPSRQGIMQYRLYLIHRYEQYYISLESFESMSYSFEPLFAVWDLVQNYMDTTKPLPDIPVLEKFRHLDPVTVAHDKQTGRNPHYWADMDKQTFKQKISENNQLIAHSDMSTRSNLMARHVEYRYS